MILRVAAVRQRLVDHVNQSSVTVKLKARVSREEGGSRMKGSVSRVDEVAMVLFPLPSPGISSVFV